MIMRRTLGALLLSALLMACYSTRKELVRAAVYEREGMQQEAYDLYAEVHARKPRSVDAHVGMRRVAQSMFDGLQNKASSLYMLNDPIAGDRARQEAADFRVRMAREGMDLSWDPLLETRRLEARHAEADRLFSLAEEAFRQDRFADAEDLAGRCLKLEPGRKEADFLLQLATLEPRYRQGKRAMETGLWRAGFREFKRITDQDMGYKDSWSLLEECRSKASYTLAYIPLFNKALYADGLGFNTPGQLESQLAANVKQNVLDLNDPLILLVDRDNTDQLLAEQQRQMTGIYDDRHVAEAGQLLGARYVLTTKILRFDDLLRKEIEVQMQLIDAQTGRIHASEIVRVNKQEIARGGPRAQLLDRASKRVAAQLREFDPWKR